jgi:hypothetical protein
MTSQLREPARELQSWTPQNGVDAAPYLNGNSGDFGNYGNS